MNHRNSEPRFVICVHNKDYPASLELRKIYRVLTDKSVAKHKLIRVIDESGQDYLYPAAYFIPIALPKATEKAVLLAS